MKNIVLIGMPGAGKSTIGAVLADKLGFTFLDTDTVIEQKYGKKLCQIIEQVGERRFLEMENETVAALSAENCVIATGGSIVFGKEAMAHLHQIGTVVYLKWDVEQLENRLGDLKARGVILNGSRTVREIFAVRGVLYERYADLTLDGSDRSAEACAEQIVDFIKKA